MAWTSWTRSWCWRVAGSPSAARTPSWSGLEGSTIGYGRPGGARMTQGAGTDLDQALVRAGRYLQRGVVSADRRTGGGQLLPGPLELRQGGPVHPRRELHGLVLVEGVRQGRDHHLGGAADGLPVGGSRPAGLRAARLPAGGRVLLVHVLAHPGQVPLRPRRAAGGVPGGQGEARR